MQFQPQTRIFGLPFSPVHGIASTTINMRLLCLSLILLLPTLCPAAPRGLPAQHGIPNFGQVTVRLYRGAMPSPAALTNLVCLSVKSIIDLRIPDKHTAAEQSLARSLNLVHTNVPLAGLGAPTHEQVNKVLSLLESLPGPVFLHCEHGCDRTGTIVACFRIRNDKWSNADALA